MLENDYLEMANHAKAKIDEKDKIIEFLKNKMDVVENRLRKMEYKISNMTYLTTYKKGFDEDTGFDFYAECLLNTLKECYEIVDVSRDELQTDEDDEQIVLMLTIADDSDDLTSSTETN
jgi:DNA recombination-dependent growth factor C